MPRSYRYLHYDVFTDHLFGGNQLAVVLDGRGLATATMQAIAKEMNFSDRAGRRHGAAGANGFLGRPVSARSARDAAEELPVFLFSTEKTGDKATVYSRMFAPGWHCGRSGDRRRVRPLGE